MRFANPFTAFRAASRGRDELAFLPAALEIVETPPPPLAGWIGGTIIALFCLALAWAAFSSQSPSARSASNWAATKRIFDGS